MIAGRATPALLAAMLLLAGPPPAAAQIPDDCGPPALRVEIDVHHVRSADGWVTAVLYDDDPANFLKTGRRAARVRIAARPREMSLCLAAPAPGRYAIAVFHDENADGRLDQGLLGIPNEGFEFSNNPRLRLGPPRLADALFTVGETAARLQIGLTYL